MIVKLSKLFSSIGTFISCYITYLGIGLIVILILFPLVVSSPYFLRIATVCLMYIMMTLALNLLTGFGGLMSLGHAAFWGVGSYTAAILTTRYGWSTGPALLSAAAIAGIFGLLLGLPVLKLKSYYLTVVTLGFCEIIRLVELNWTSLTRGSLGIHSIPYPILFGFEFRSRQSVYYLVLFMAVLTTFIIYSIIHSRVGKAITAVRDDEIAASSIGINVVGYKVMVFIISAVIMGIAGAFYAQYIHYIDPSLFTTSTSMNLLLMAIFGGLGSIPGSILGATVLTVLPETIRFLQEYRNLIYGILIVLLMLLKPSGLLGNVNMEYIKQRFNQRKTEGANDEQRS